MSASFQITFATVGGTDYTLTISNCNPLLGTPAVVSGLANIISSGALATPYGKPTSAKKVVLLETGTQTIEVK